MSMSNEELAMLIQQGNTGAAAELWENCRRLLYMYVWRYYNIRDRSLAAAGVEVCDLEQECYFIMLDAVKAFSPEKGYRFSSYLTFHIRNHFNQMCGLRGRREPLNDGFRLETPIGDDEDSTSFGDIIPDPCAAAEFDNVTEADERKGIRRIVRSAVKRLPEKERIAICMRYYEGAGYRSISERIGEPEEKIQRILSRAMKTLTGDRQVWEAAERVGLLYWLE